MKKRTAGLLILAFLFFGLGLFWLVAIYQRCEAIYPTRKPKQAISQKAPGPVVEKEKQDNLIFIRFLSPHVKWHHLLFFWAIALFELIAGFLFMLASLAILRLYRRGWIWVFTALTGDIVFKFAVGLYMFFCAIPLARVTGNKNNLLTYYMPDKSLYSTISAYLSGIKMYPPFGQLLNAVIYAAFMLGCFYYFTRKDVQERFGH